MDSGEWRGLGHGQRRRGTRAPPHSQSKRGTVGEECDRKIEAVRERTGRERERRFSVYCLGKDREEFWQIGKGKCELAQDLVLLGFVLLFFTST